MPNTLRNHRYQRVLNSALVIGATAIVAAWLLYSSIGHRVVEHAYGSDSQLVSYIMAGRSETPLQTYVDKADTFVLLATFWAMALLALLAALKRPTAFLYTVLSLALIFLVVIASLDAKPQLAHMVGLDAVGYYWSRNTLVPDAEVVYRNKPLLHTRVDESADAHPYGIHAVQTLSDWTTDEEGFRNARAAASCDVVLIGDGMLDSGRTLAETFGSRLGQHLQRCVANLGVSGHGPLQFVRTFERYGIPKRPAYAVLAFNEGNDLQDVEKYNSWKAGSATSFWGGYEVTISGRVARLRFAARETLNHVWEQMWRYASNAVLEPSGAAHPLAGSLAWIRLPTQATFPMVFVDRVQTQSADAIQRTHNWEQIRTLLSRFRALSAEHHITPAILFVPTAAHIYAEYSTDRSGRDWLQVRDEQIHARENLETAIAQLSAELGIPFISLSPPFEEAAKNGAALYDSFSVHMTAQGADIGGRHVAAALAAVDDRTRHARAQERSRHQKGSGAVDSRSAGRVISRNGTTPAR